MDGRIRVDGGSLDSEQKAVSGCVVGWPNRGKGIAIGGNRSDNWKGGTNRGLGVAGLVAVGAVRYGHIVGPAHRCGFGVDLVVKAG